MFSTFTSEAPKKISKRDTNYGPGKYYSKKPQQEAPTTGRKGTSRILLLKGIVKRAMNDKSASKNNKMAYGYDPKLLKEYEHVLTWLNQIIIENPE